MFWKNKRARGRDGGGIDTHIKTSTYSSIQFFAILFAAAKIDFHFGSLAKSQEKNLN